MSEPDMTDPELPDEERLATEYALGLLEGAEALKARGLMASNPAFAASVARWEDKLAPLLHTLPPLEPGADVWPKIQAALAEPAAEVEVLALRRKVRTWQITTGLSAAAAVALAFFAAPIFNGPSPVEPATTAPLAANIPIGDTQLRLAVTYLPDREEMLVSASGLTADGVHDHELWVVLPEGEGAPQSLGVVVPGKEQRMQLEAALAARLQDGAQLVLTREPLGGAAPGTAAGPVVASGNLQKT